MCSACHQHRSKRLSVIASPRKADNRCNAGKISRFPEAREKSAALERIAGRIVFNGWPTGVAVVAAQHHGGPWPATTAPARTSVGSAAIRRWLVPVAYQNFPPELLPAPLR